MVAGTDCPVRVMLPTASPRQNIGRTSRQFGVYARAASTEEAILLLRSAPVPNVNDAARLQAGGDMLPSVISHAMRTLAVVLRRDAELTFEGRPGSCAVPAASIRWRGPERMPRAAVVVPHRCRTLSRIRGQRRHVRPRLGCRQDFVAAPRAPSDDPRLRRAPGLTQGQRHPLATPTECPAPRRSPFQPRG